MMEGSEKKRVRLGDQLQRLAADLHPQASRVDEALVNKATPSHPMPNEVTGSQKMFQKLNKLRQSHSGSNKWQINVQSKQSKKPQGLNLKQVIQAAGKVVIEPPTGRVEAKLRNGKGDGKGEIENNQEILDKVHMLPMDWSLKMKALFTSNMPFGSFQGTFFGPPSKGHEAVRSFASGNRRSNDPEQMYRQALLSWVFPLSSLPKGLESTANAGIRQALVQNRYELWMEAFRDLIYATYQGQCCAFYCLPPTGSPDSFVAFFASNQIQGRSAVSACLSHSSKGMRSLLRLDYDLQFSMPLNGSHVVDQSSKLNKSEEPVDCPDGSPQSLLFFNGKEQVHGLFDFLLNECGNTYHKGCDVPILLSPVPFEGASIKRCQANHRNFRQKLQNSKVVPLNDEDTDDSQKSFYQLEIEDCIPPWVLDRLCSTFRRTQAGQFDAYFEPLPTTTNLNVNSFVSKDEDNHINNSFSRSNSIYGGGFWDTEESEKWFASPSVTSKRSIVKIHSKKGIFRVTMK